MNEPQQGLMPCRHEALVHAEEEGCGGRCVWEAAAGVCLGRDGPQPAQPEAGCPGERAVPAHRDPVRAEPGSGRKGLRVDPEGPGHAEVASAGMLPLEA